MMHWWLQRGADGFRMDVVRVACLKIQRTYTRLSGWYGGPRSFQVNLFAKASGLPDAPVLFPDREFQPFGNLVANQPKIHEYLKEMNREVLSVGRPSASHDRLL